MKRKTALSLLMLCLLLGSCGAKEERLRNGVTYAKNALAAAGANPLSRASYESYIARGQTPVDYIKATLPKENPVFDSFEYGEPTKPGTVVIRPGTEPNEYSIEGYGNDLKKPVVTEYVTVNIPSE